jgi:hypothetical protein
MPLVVIFLGVMILFGPPWLVGVALIVIGALWAVLR